MVGCCTVVSPTVTSTIVCTSDSRFVVNVVPPPREPVTLSMIR